MDVDALIDKHSRSGIIVDANLLLLYFVGRHNPMRIQKHKRTSDYTSDDLLLLVRLLARFARIVVTPTVLAEVSNLIGQVGEPLRSELMNALGEEIQVLSEEYLPSREAANVGFFPQLGLTDSAIYLVARDGLLVLTTDWRLGGLLEARGVAVVNFNHIRPFELT